MQKKVVLITGAAKRIGLCVAHYLHQRGYHIALHYHQSKAEAITAVQELNQQRQNSAFHFYANLNDTNSYPELIQAVVAQFGQLDILINNASSFYPTPALEATQQDWQDLFSTNACAPFFLAQQAFEMLSKQQGLIVNMTDIHIERTLTDHPIYCAAKSALHSLTLSLAKSFAPLVRVNAISPGAILWPDGLSDDKKHDILSHIPLARLGMPLDIAKAIGFFIDNTYVTGQNIAIDGGKRLT